MDGQLSDITGEFSNYASLTLSSEETTFTIIAETNDDLEPGSSDGVSCLYQSLETPADDQASSPWAPALQGDTLAPLVGHHAPLYSVRAIETGVIDVSCWLPEFS